MSGRHICETTHRTDDVIKPKQYERFGVREYWIVDPELETVKVHRLTGQGFQRAAELAKESGDTLSTPLLPDLQLPLAAIFGARGQAPAFARLACGSRASAGASPQAGASPFRITSGWWRQQKRIQWRNWTAAIILATLAKAQHENDSARG